MKLPWGLTRRPNQEAPPGDWFTWLILAGRGWGKTRTGAEFVLERMVRQGGIRGALVGITFDDVRDTMVEGESGIASILDARRIRHAWNRSLGQLILPNGSRADAYSSEKPRQLRGPQHHVAWGDEPAHWNDAEVGDKAGTTWSNLKLGLRLGEDPRVILTTTPQHVRLLYGDKRRGLPGLLDNPLVAVTKGRTHENLENLAEQFYRTVVEPYEGTRLGKQELDAEDIGDIEGALWARELIAHRAAPRIVRDGALTTAYRRIVVGVDPNAGAEGGDEAGIIADGVADCDRTCKNEGGCAGHGWALEDRSTAGGPTAWAEASVALYHELGADRIVAEANNGGEMVRLTIHTIDPSVPVTLVHASRGKWTRAEPVAALYERGRFAHAKALPELEEELCTWLPSSGQSPNRLDAHVWAATSLLLSPWSGVSSDQSWIA